MKIFIGSDHAGFAFKQEVVERFKNRYTLVDVGPFTDERCDYPDLADQVVQEWRKEKTSGGEAYGVLICGSGQGVAMRANKYPDVRAAVCWNEESAKLSRQHNDANFMCTGARLVSLDTIFQMFEIFIAMPFEGGRHADRVKKISAPV